MGVTRAKRKLILVAGDDQHKRDRWFAMKQNKGFLEKLSKNDSVRFLYESQLPMILKAQGMLQENHPSIVMLKAFPRSCKKIRQYLMAAT